MSKVERAREFIDLLNKAQEIGDEYLLDMPASYQVAHALDDWSVYTSALITKLNIDLQNMEADQLKAWESDNDEQ